MGIGCLGALVSPKPSSVGFVLPHARDAGPLPAVPGFGGAADAARGDAGNTGGAHDDDLRDGPAARPLAHAASPTMCRTHCGSSKTERA